MLCVTTVTTKSATGGVSLLYPVNIDLTDVVKILMNCLLTSATRQSSSLSHTLSFSHFYLLLFWYLTRFPLFNFFSHLSPPSILLFIYCLYFSSDRFCLFTPLTLPLSLPFHSSGILSPLSDSNFFPDSLSFLNSISEKLLYKFKMPSDAESFRRASNLIKTFHDR